MMWGTIGGHVLVMKCLDSCSSPVFHRALPFHLHIYTHTMADTLATDKVPSSHPPPNATMLSYRYDPKLFFEKESAEHQQQEIEVSHESTGQKRKTDDESTDQPAQKQRRVKKQRQKDFRDTNDLDNVEYVIENGMQLVGRAAFHDRAI